MAEKRKDKAGRVLKSGESQRSDGRYMYRYTDKRGKRHTVYATTLQDLRVKEEKINQSIRDGLDYASGMITVEELVRKYIALKKDVLRYNTLESYEISLLAIQRDEFGSLPINVVKKTDVREFFLRLFHGGRKYKSIETVKRPLCSAFKMAVDEDIIRKNPADIKLDFIPNNSVERKALTAEQQNMLLDFIRLDKHFKAYYDEVIVLLDTGLRIGEFCGLTMQDLDFENRKISVNHQLIRKKNGELMIEKTKTKSGERYVPMTRRVYESLHNIIDMRMVPETEPSVDGYTNFLLLNRKGKPLPPNSFAQSIRNLINKYERETGNKLSNVTPHVFRHTFCTNLVNAGIDAKSIQYLMGHSNVKITLDVYAHSGYDRAEEAVKKFSDMMNNQ